jgi:hypothetical protein
VNEPSDAEIEKKVVDCVRYCCSRSASKHLEAVFFMGNLTGKEFLMQRLKGIIYSNPDREEMAWTPWQVDMVGLNLFKGYALGKEERDVQMRILTWVMAGAFILAALFAVKAFQIQTRLQQARATFSSPDYQLALDLKEKIKQFKGGK